MQNVSLGNDSVVQLIGTLFMWCLYGILIAQCLFYYISFPNDHKAVKMLVVGVFLLDTLQTVAGTDFSWRLFVSGWGNPDSLGLISWSIVAVPILTGLVSTVVQFFFAWRVHVLSKWRILPVLIGILSVAQGVSAMIVGARITSLGSMENIMRIYPNVITWLGGSCLVDALVAGAMVYVCQTSRANLPRESPTLVLLGRIAVMSVETGLVTTAAALADLVLEINMSQTNMHLAPCISITKLYSNSMLVSLNARVRYTQRPSYTTSGSAQIPSKWGEASARHTRTEKTLDIVDVHSLAVSVSVDTVVNHA